jgi:hypothetical protein
LQNFWYSILFAQNGKDHNEVLAALGAGTTHDVYAAGIDSNYNPDGDPPE